METRTIIDGKPFLKVQFGQFVIVTDIENNDIKEQAKKVLLWSVERSKQGFPFEIKELEFIEIKGNPNNSLYSKSTIGVKCFFFGRAWQIKKIQAKGNNKRVKKVWLGRRRKAISRYPFNRRSEHGVD